MRMEGISKGRKALWVRLVFRLMRWRSGAVPQPLRIYAWRPDILRTFLSLGRAVRKPGALPERLKGLAMYRTARLVECAF
jgi:hypothetical protein